MSVEIKLSVAIPAYNRASLIQSLLESICKQTEEGDEVIVSDDGSTDGTADQASKMPNVRVLRNERNLGMVGNWNACLRAATRDWICIVHDDDRLEPGAFAALRHACSLAAGPALIVHQYVGNPTDNSFRCKYSSPGMWGVLNCPTIPSGAIVHRTIVDSIGLFDPRFSYTADLEYFARIAAKYPLIIVENPRVQDYRLHGANYQFKAWRQADLYPQFEELQRTIISYAKIGNGPKEREMFEERLA